MYILLTGVKLINKKVFCKLKTVAIIFQLQLYPQLVLYKCRKAEVAQGLPEIQWTCSLCSLPFSQEECLTTCLQEEFISINNNVEEDDYANSNAGEAVYANALDAMKPCIGDSPGREHSINQQ